MISLHALARAREAAGMRLYYAGDVHGSEKCWRKFLNAAKFYEADTLIMGGDITGQDDGARDRDGGRAPRGPRPRPARDRLGRRGSRTWRSGSGSTASTRTGAIGPSTTA